MSKSSTLQDAKLEMYRTQILLAAEQEFGVAGFAGTKMESVAATAGVSLATVYKVFDGKLDIWNALHRERMEALLRSVAAATPEVASPFERLIAGMAASARFLTENDAYLNMNVRAELGWASSERTGLGVQASVWTAGLDMIASGVEAAIALGELPPIRPRVAAGMVVSALQVWLTDWTATGRDRSSETLVDELILRMRWLLAGPQH
jgi:AcrR family transcriptional regulator